MMGCKNEDKTWHMNSFRSDKVFDWQCRRAACTMLYSGAVFLLVQAFVGLPHSPVVTVSLIVSNWVFVRAKQHRFS